MATVQATLNMINNYQKIIHMTQVINNNYQQINTTLNDANITINNGLKQTESSVKSLVFGVIAKGVKLAQKLGGVIGGAMAISDDMANTNARLAFANDGLRTQAGLQQQVLDIANRTRTSYSATAGLITKLGVGTQGLFKNNDDLLDFTDKFNKSLVISGVSAADAENAMQQMSQTLGDGVVQGDELRHLLDTAPAMMQILSGGLGISGGELMQMAANDQLTADQFVKAFQKQSGDIDKMFEDMPVTFGGAMTVLDNIIKGWVGSLGEAGGPLARITELVVLLTTYLQSDAVANFLDGLAVGISEAVSWMIQLVEYAAQVFSFFSENWSLLGPIVWGLAAAIAGLTLAINWSTIATRIAATAQALWNAIMNANPIVLIITLIASLILILYKLWTTNDNFVAGVMRAWNFILNIFDQLPAYFWQLVEWMMVPFIVWSQTIGKLFDHVINNIINGINVILSLIDRVTGSTFALQGKFNMEDIAGKIADFAGTEKDEAYARAAKKAQERDQKLSDMMADRAANRAKQQADEEAKGGPRGSSASLFSQTGVPAASIDKVDKVGSVGKIEDKVDISSEDLKTMRELAEMKSIQNFVTLTPTVSVSTGDINHGADLDSIISQIAVTLEEEIASSASRIYA
ncbi:tape measure protein [Paenibacillus bouchesdurhonensis]|uniref:tape measure protein n=1 Tax=Paenibacillus bouchesdurhonensis TaxID=1870990 RepID=UPI0019025B20|nr:tape measure protein [Paenibacillus bouchesdurhonensis]